MSLALTQFETLKKKRKKSFAVIIALLIATLFCAVYALSSGSSPLAFSKIISFVAEKLSLASASLTQAESYIISELRLPRLCMAILTGIVLASSGAAMQGVFRNPLADPGILGVNSGASLGAALMIVLGTYIIPESLGAFRLYSIPLGAFLGALIVTVLLYKIGSVNGRTNTAMLLLGGIALQAMVGAALGLLTFIADEEELRSLTFWSMGSLDISGWQELAFLAPICFFAYFMIHRQAKALNSLLLGEAEAIHLGYNVQSLKIQLIIWTSLAVGVTVAFTGGIGFIGLVAPHLIRLMLGPDHRILFPASALCGACLLLIADTLARTIASPVEIPIGIITAALGSPFFLALLFKARNKGFSL